MYVKLKLPYMLRGFQGIPYILVDQEKGKSAFLDVKIFELLQYCDGTIDLDTVFLKPEQKQFLTQAIEKQIVEMSETPGTIEPIQRYRKAENKYIRSIHWSVTGRCNLKCRHCYMSAPDYKYHDMTTEECFSMIDQFEEANVMSVSITGGEALVRKDIYEIMDRIYEKGMGITQLYTNGLLVDEKVLDWFEERNKKPEFVLSYDCVGCHDWMRGIDGAEVAAIKAIKLLKERGFRVMIETAICGRSIRTLLETYELLRDLKVDFWKTSLVFEAGKWSEQNEEKVTEEELYEKYLQIIEHFGDDKAPMSIQLDGFFAGKKDHLEVYELPYEKKNCTEENCSQINSCLTCRIHPYLLPDGTFLPCASMTDSIIEKEMPNLRTTTISEVYRNPKHPFFRLSNIRISEVIEANEECRNCEYRYQCGGGCRAMSMFAGNGVMGYSPVLCLWFKQNYKAKIQSIMENKIKNM